MNRRLSAHGGGKANLFSVFGAGDAIPRCVSGSFNRVTREVHAVGEYQFSISARRNAIVEASPVAKIDDRRALLRLAESRQGRLSLTDSALTRCSR